MMASLLSAVDTVASWDPIGVAEPPSVPSARAELLKLRVSVKEFIEAVQGLPSERAAEDSAGLAECLQECLQEWRDETEANQRELQAMRTTVSRLQEELRRQHEVSTPTATTPSGASAGMASLDAQVLCAREEGRAEGIAAGRARGREEAREEARAKAREEARTETEAAVAAAVAAAVHEQAAELRREVRVAHQQGVDEQAASAREADERLISG